MAQQKRDVEVAIVESGAPSAQAINLRIPNWGNNLQQLRNYLNSFRTMASAQ